MEEGVVVVVEGGGGGHGKRCSQRLKPASQIKLQDWLLGFEVSLIVGI